jgi:hypothetical protein
MKDNGERDLNERTMTNIEQLKLFETLFKHQGNPLLLVSILSEQMHECDKLFLN